MADSIADKGNETEVKSVCQAVIALTMPPKGQKLIGTSLRMDINGQVLVFDSTIKRVETIWKTNEGHLYAVPNVLLECESFEELRKVIHERVDKVFESWKVLYPDIPVSIEPIHAEPQQESPKSEEPKIVDITVESNMANPQAKAGENSN